MTSPVPTPAHELPTGVDVRLVAVDMDGTLLDDDHEVDTAFWPVMAELTARGVVVCPASGRQAATLQRMFPDADALVVIGENGAIVARGDDVLRTSPLDRPTADHVVRTVRGLRRGGTPVNTVLCGLGSAWIEDPDTEFLEQAERLYARLKVVDDLLAVDDVVLKTAVYDGGVAQETTYPALEPLTASHQVVVSGQHWVDVMDLRTSKGAALRHLQETLGVTSAQTVAFGDYLNDVELLAAADHSFAMVNGHPDVLGRARYLAPANTDHGVTRTLQALLGLP